MKIYNEADQRDYTKYSQILVGIGVVEIGACFCLMAAGVPALSILGIFILKLLMVLKPQRNSTLKAKMRSFSQTVNLVKVGK